MAPLAHGPTAPWPHGPTVPRPHGMWRMAHGIWPMAQAYGYMTNGLSQYMAHGLGLWLYDQWPITIHGPGPGPMVTWPIAYRNRWPIAYRNRWPMVFGVEWGLQDYLRHLSERLDVLLHEQLQPSQKGRLVVAPRRTQHNLPTHTYIRPCAAEHTCVHVRVTHASVHACMCVCTRACLHPRVCACVCAHACATLRRTSTQIDPAVDFAA